MKVLTDNNLTVLWNRLKKGILNNRNYEPTEFSGKGYKVLEKNIQTIDGVNKNILTAVMINQPNTIYEIRYDFDLNGETIEMQEGCTLKFCGGSLKNGTINGKATDIDTTPVKIFSTEDLYIKGTWNIKGAYAEWFGADPTAKKECSSAFNAVINHTNFNSIFLIPKAHYEISDTINMKCRDFSFGTIGWDYSHEDSNSEEPLHATFQCSNTVGAPIMQFADAVSNIHLYGFKVVMRWAVARKSDGFFFSSGKTIIGCSFEGISALYCEVGFHVIFDTKYHGFSLNTFKNCRFDANNVGLYINTEDWSVSDDNSKKFWMNSNNFSNCHFSYNLNGGLCIHGVYSCEQNLFQSCCFESNGRNHGREGIPGETPWTTGRKYGVQMLGYGYGISTFDNCYFEINCVVGTNSKGEEDLSNRKEITETSENTSTNENIMADIILRGANVNLRSCTFNFGISPIVSTGNNFIGISIKDCDFKERMSSIGGSYLSSSLITLRDMTPSVIGDILQKSYINIEESFLEDKWEFNYVKKINFGNEVDFGFFNMSIHTPKFNATKNIYTLNTSTRSFIDTRGSQMTFVNLKKYGKYSEKPDISNFFGTTGFMYFCTDITPARVICWNGTTWVNIDGTELAAVTSNKQGAENPS